MGWIYALKSTWYLVSTKGEHAFMESCKIPQKVGQQQKYQADKTTEIRQLQACQIKGYKPVTVWSNHADDQIRLRALL
jgi:hypothetical protein